MDQPQKEPTSAKPQLGLWDAVSIIIGIIIGATIYETPPFIYNNLSGVGIALGIWVLVGVLSLVGAFTYAELATTYPRSGGDYNYLTRAFGPWLGFLFSWAQLTVIHTGGMGLLAYIFADYTHRLFWGKTDDGKQYTFVFAALAVLVLTVVNMAGLVMGKWTQNVLTALKVLGLAAIVVGGLAFGKPHDHVQGKVSNISGDRLSLQVGDSEKRSFLVPEGVPIKVLPPTESKVVELPKGRDRYELADLKPNKADEPLELNVIVKRADPERAIQVEELGKPPQFPGFGLAMVLVFLAFSGYNDAAYVAAEVGNRRRNLPLALILGVAGAAVIYLLINAAYIYGLGFEQARRSNAIAADILGLYLGERGEQAMCVLVMISALGAINGSILTGSRVFATLGNDHWVFGWMSGRSSLTKAPIAALITQGVISLVLIWVVGTSYGKELVDRAFEAMGMGKLKWEGHGGFETLLKFTTPIFWFFFLLTSLSLFVLRERDPHLPRPFSVPLYPLLPLFFCGTCVYMLYSGIGYAGQLGLIGVWLLFVGIILYWISTGGRIQGEPPPDPFASEPVRRIGRDD